MAFALVQVQYFFGFAKIAMLNMIIIIIIPSYLSGPNSSIRLSSTLKTTKQFNSCSGT